jgi:hypothetical protein
MRLRPERPDTVRDEGLYNSLMAMFPDIIIDSDELVYTTDRSIPKNSLSTTYVNLFTDFAGRPILINTTGYSRGAIQIFWNKNGGVGTHSLKIVKHNDTSQILYENTNLIDGENLDVNFVPPVPLDFKDFIGKLRIQVKSSNGTDNPIFEGIRLYLRK